MDEDNSLRAGQFQFPSPRVDVLARVIRHGGSLHLFENNRPRRAALSPNGAVRVKIYNLAGVLWNHQTVGDCMRRRSGGADVLTPAFTGAWPG